MGASRDLIKRSVDNSLAARGDRGLEQIRKAAIAVSTRMDSTTTSNTFRDGREDQQPCVR